MRAGREATLWSQTLPFRCSGVCESLTRRRPPTVDRVLSAYRERDAVRNADGNDELGNRTELNSSSAFLEAIFTSVRSAVVVLDRELPAQVWNAGASDLWDLRLEEARRASFFSLDIGLPVADLHQPLKDVLSGSTQ